MSTLLVRHAQVLATMDDSDNEIVDGGLFAVDGSIRQVGPTATAPGHSRRGRGLLRPRGASRSHQHPSPPLSDPHPGGPRCPGCGPVRLAADAVPDLGADDARRTSVSRPELALLRTRPVGLHDRLPTTNTSGRTVPRLDDQIEGAATMSGSVSTQHADR